MLGAAKSDALATSNWPTIASFIVSEVLAERGGVEGIDESEEPVELSGCAWITEDELSSMTVGQVSHDLLCFPNPLAHASPWATKANAAAIAAHRRVR
jgi:hypothetical protein